MCLVVVITSGSNARLASVQSVGGERFEQLIMRTYAEYRARYGAIRIARELNEHGSHCSVNYVADIMSEKGIKARNGKSFKYSRDVAAMSNVADNILRRDFQSDTANRKWGGHRYHLHLGG